MFTQGYNLQLFLPKCANKSCPVLVDLHQPFVRVSLRGRCRSVGSCWLCCDIHVQTCSSLTYLSAVGNFILLPNKKKKESCLFLVHTCPCTICLSFIVCCKSSIKCFVWQICDSYANKTKKRLLKEKSTQCLFI